MSGKAELTIAVLLVCRNRRETTLCALKALHAAAVPGIALQAVLFDDASTDGTVEAVTREFPETMVVHGDGNAFWNGGLFKAWSAALDLPAQAFLWLNDDVELDADAFTRLHGAWQEMIRTSPDKDFILVGSTRGSDGQLTYGGNRLVRSPFAIRLPLVAPTNELTSIDTFNGNFVLVPREVVNRIGLNDPEYFHNLGDHDYGLRASRAGVAVRLLPGTIGVCESNHAKKQKGYGSRSLSVREQWRKVNTHHGLPFRSWWRFTRRFSGKWFPIHFLAPYRKLLGFRR